MTQREFKNLLYEVWLKSSGDFSGIGLVVCNSTANLPIVSLRDTEPDMAGRIVEVLSRVSSKNSEYHDGFHFLNEEGELTHVAQYFSPPVAQGVYFDRSRIVGGRYVAALFGSSIPEVIRTGIVSERHGLSIFESAQEVYFEELQ